MRSNKFAELYIESDDEIVKDVHPNALLIKKRFNRYYEGILTKYEIEKIHERMKKHRK